MFIIYSFLTLNDTITLKKASKRDAYGLPIAGEAREVAVQLTEKTESEKVGLSSSKAHGEVFKQEYVIKFPSDVEVSVSDTVEIDGVDYRFTSYKRYRDLSGNVIYTRVTT